jgi:putative protein kinase ArgK-like GTPase of G3E family
MTEAEIKRLIKIIKAAPQNKQCPVKFVAVDGHGGAGKSTLAENLAKPAVQSLGRK